MSRKKSAPTSNPALESQLANQSRQYESMTQQLQAQNTQAAQQFQSQLEGVTRMYEGRLSDLGSQMEGQRSYYDQLLGQLNSNLENTRAQSEQQKAEFENLKKIQDDQIAMLQQERDRSATGVAEQSRNLLNSSTAQSNNFMQSLDMQRRLRALRSGSAQSSQSNNLLR